MSPSPNPQAPSSAPFTQTSDFDTASFASLFSTKSEMNGLPSSIPSSLDAAQSSAKSSMMAALSSQLDSSAGSSQSTTLATSTTAASNGISSSTPSAASAASASSAAATSSSGTSASAANTAVTSTNGAASSGAVASSAANSASNDLHKESGTMSSPGMQAAVAVPIVVVVLAIIAIIFFCMRRRKKRQASSMVSVEENEKSPPMSRKKKWTRHLRVFSFDTELLMGGRYSSTNSIRSRQTGSLRSGNRSQHSETPSLHSVDEVAPPYRDAISAGNQPNIASVMARAPPAAAAAPAVTSLNRSASTATAGTAPPPYGAAGRLQPSPSIRSRREPQDPFADNGNSPISPVAEGSPFQDPPNPSRNSSIYRSERDDVSNFGGASDAGSIRQATVARNASVMSGGRIIENVSRSSQ